MKQKLIKDNYSLLIGMKFVCSRCAAAPGLLLLGAAPGAPGARCLVRCCSGAVLLLYDILYRFWGGYIIMYSVYRYHNILYVFNKK